MSIADDFKSRMIAQLKAKVKAYRLFERKEPPTSFKDFARGYISAYAESESIHTSLIDFEEVFKAVMEDTAKV